MEVGSVFVAGASRGIGLELVRQIVNLPKPPKYVFATYRQNAQDLKAIKDSSNNCQVHLIKMDVRDKASIQAARKVVEETVGENGLNFLINNAGVLQMERFPELSDENMLYHFQTNTMGPIAVLKEMFPLLQKASSHQSSGMGVSRAMVLNISSRGGSCSSMGESQPRKFLGVIAYRISKAALNMAMRVITQEVKDYGILVVMMCPGFVRTDMVSGPEYLELTTATPPQEASENVADILKTCTLLNETHQGAFIDRNGKPIPF